MEDYFGGLFWKFILELKLGSWGYLGGLGHFEVSEGENKKKVIVSGKKKLMGWCINTKPMFLKLRHWFNDPTDYGYAGAVPSM